MNVVNYEIAKKLKEKGFREECLLHYTDTGNLLSNSIDTYDRPNQELDYRDFQKCFNNGNSIGLVDAPTISQVLEWLRKEKKISIEPGIHWTLKWTCGIYGLNDNISDFTQRDNDGFILYDSYEQALLAGIEYVLDNVIKKMIHTVDDLINVLTDYKNRYPEFGKYNICVNASNPDDNIPTLKEPMLYINTDIGQVEIYTEDDE